MLKSAVVSSVSVGATVTFSLVINNSGPAAANGATFVDSLPLGLSNPAIASVTVSGGASATVMVSGTQVSGTATGLPAGGEVVVVFTALANGSVSGVITNTASVSTPPGVTDTTPSNNSSSVAVNVVQLKASVSGRVWLDSDGNKLYTIGKDVDLSGWTVELLRGGVVVATAVTGVSGTYTIANQIPGAGYSVRFRNPVGNYVTATPLNQSLLADSGLPDRLSTGATVNQSTGPLVISGAIDGITLYPGDNVAEQNLPIDPQGVVYDSVTRTILFDASVTIVFDGQGFNPAIHLLPLFPGDVPSGVQSGLYQFILAPNAPSGIYRLIVSPPPGYVPGPAILGGVARPGVSPGSSGVAPDGTYTPPLGTAFVNVQPQGTPPVPAIVGAGSINTNGTQYFLSFNLSPGVANVFHNHIPLDPIASGALLVSKVGDKSVAEVADSVRYFIRIRNTTAGAIPNVQLEDLLPAGFRYIPGTARLTGTGVALPGNVQADPAGGIGRALTFNIGAAGAIPANTTWELSYFVRLGVGSQQGDGINRATAVFQGVSGPVRSNTAQFRVRVQGGVFSNDGCIIGKVYADCDGNSMQNNESGSRELGIPGVRLIMLDGTQIITDNEGKYSICGVKAQTHVIKVDRTTLPKGSRLLPSSNRNAGVGDSIFVDLKGGELARADFIEGSCSPEVLDQVKARRAQGGILAPEKETTPDFKIDNRPAQVEQQILPSLRPEAIPPVNTGAPKP
jgi:uncharacterized repeat protein (TIGR01451 family)